MIVDENPLIGPGGVVADPDDTGIAGATLAFDFTEAGPITMQTLNYIDVEPSHNGFVELFDVGNNSIGVFPIVPVGDNGVGTLDMQGTTGVNRMEVVFGGSGAMTDFTFDPEPFVFCDTGVNSTGNAATIDFDGSISISANMARLVFTDLPPNRPGYIIYGGQRISAPFGGGTRCVGGMTSRVTKIPPFGSNGSAVVPLDFTQPPLGAGPNQVQPGDRCYFQLWFRDGQGPGGFNTTSGMCVVFTP